MNESIKVEASESMKTPLDEHQQEFGTNESAASAAQVADAKAHEETIWQALTKHKVTMCIVFGLAIAPMMDGYDTIAMNLCLTMPAFRRDFGVNSAKGYVIEADWQSAWAALYQIGIALGALGSAQVTDRFGRRVGLWTGCLISAVGTALVFTATSKGVFLAAKIIIGLAIGILIATCQVYNSEIVPLRLRGPLLASFTFMYIVGQLIAISIVHGRVSIMDRMAYRLPFALEWIWPSVLAIVALVIPESPWHLFRKGKLDAAANSLRRLHGKDHDVKAEIALMQVVTEEEKANKAASASISYLDCFRGTDRRRTLIACFAVLLQQGCGVVFYSNSSYFLLQAGMPAGQSIMATEIGIALGLPANAISWFTMSRFGRRPLLLMSTGIVCCIMLAVGVAGSVPRTSASLWTLGGLLIVSPFFYNLGVGPIFPSLSSEITSTRLRAKSQSISFFTFAFGQFLFNLFFPYMYNSTAGNLGGKCGYFFAGLSFISLFVIYFFVPETFGRSYAELDEIFEHKVSARQSSSYVCRGIGATSSNTASAHTELTSV